MDLSVMNEVKKGAAAILSQCDEIQVLINNACGMYPQGKTSSEGLDLTFTTNHLGHFCLFQELLPALRKGRARVIQVSSEAHRIAIDPRKDFSLKRSNTVSSYAKVKLYNILFTKEINTQFGTDGLTAYSLHPGAVRTSFGSETSPLTKGLIAFTKLFFISPKAGAANSIFLGSAPLSSLRTGAYYVRQKPSTTSALGQDGQLSTELWHYSTEVLTKVLSS